MKDLHSFYRGKRVLITGHTGFKGSWLTEWLLLLGAKVTGFSLPPPTSPALFEQLALTDRCDHHIGDIRDQALVHQLISATKPDVVFHLAAQPLVRMSYAQPVETYQTNIIGTVHVLDALRAADWPCAAVIITTDKVYENHEWLYGYRESDPLGGFDPYSSSKACAELITQSYRASFFNPSKSGTRVAMTSARAGNVIGGGDMAPDRIVPDCIRALARGDSIRVRNPHATRPWQHVLEPLSGYLLLGQRLYEAVRLQQAPRPDNPSPDLANLCSAFNFGPDVSANKTVGQLVEEILKHWPGSWEDCSDPKAPHEAGLLNLAAEKAFHLLGWRSRWDFAQTIAATVKWYKAVHEQGPAAARSLVKQQIQAYVG